MSCADNSYAGKLAQLRSRTLATFHANNPVRKEQYTNSMDDSMYVSRRAGEHKVTVKPANGIPVEIVPCSCCKELAPIENVQIISVGFVPDYEDVGWNPVANATYYTVTTTYPGATVTSLGTTSVRINFTSNSSRDVPVTITAYSDCSSSVVNAILTYPCFLAGSLVHLANGTTKVIEDVLVGDVVIGAFGEYNTVLALHRPLLGSAKMISINGDHCSTAHHPHVSADKKFYCADPKTVEECTYGMNHEVINECGEAVQMMLYGLKKGRVQQICCGLALKTIEGSRDVISIEDVIKPASTQLYNLVVGGSHTYHVDGYAVTGWPREDDFDYDIWAVRLGLRIS